MELTEACRSLQNPTGAQRSPQELQGAQWIFKELRRATRCTQVPAGACRSLKKPARAHKSQQKLTGAPRNSKEPTGA